MLAHLIVLYNCYSQFELIFHSFINMTRVLPTTVVEYCGEHNSNRHRKCMITYRRREIV